MPPEPLSLDYASPIPPDSRIRCEIGPDGVSLTVDPPDRARLKREVIYPAAVLVPLGVALAVAVAWGAVHALSHWPAVSSPGTVLVLVLAWCVGLWSFVFLVRDASLNAGIITRIEVRGGQLIWTKQTLWRSRTVNWPVAGVTDVFVFSGSSLRVSRRRGLALNAFAMHRPDDLKWAAVVLRDAVRLAGGGDDGGGSRREAVTSPNPRTRSA